MQSRTAGASSARPAPSRKSTANGTSAGVSSEEHFPKASAMPSR
eukprot:CAMPEP_0177790630 /NCGR_PEP_ID=MMETSP0491_2-20121128/23466_1 /TAXON_ID=63592 /ORGANISM="Tetraselmis chuii, Strain PLY429" /LENGTH=43 /DNA_ID= /DNA_START= /DNA_END= /DNA_ORIENTATION=